MSLCEAIQKKADELEKQMILEKDKTLKEKYMQEIYALWEEKDKVATKETYEEKKYDYRGVLDDISLKGKKIISDKEYNKIKQKWEEITGETLYTSEENRYIRRKNSLMEAIKNESKEYQEQMLKSCEYEWEHRREIAKSQADLEILKMVKQLENEYMKPKKLEKKLKQSRVPRSLARNKMYKSVINVTLKEE